MILDPSVFFGIFHSTNRRWGITPRGHPIPDAIKIPFQVLFELFDRLPNWLLPSGMPHNSPFVKCQTTLVF